MMADEYKHTERMTLKDQSYPALSGPLVLLFSVACGLSVANIYAAQPMLDNIARDFGVRAAVIGIVVTTTQVGYALGLLLIVPLGDLLDRRRLIVSQLLISVGALVAAGLAPNIVLMLSAMFVVGLLAVVVQVLVAFAATLAKPEERGSVVGKVTSGVVTGILLGRMVAGALTELGGWRLVYFLSAGLLILTTVLLWKALPPGPNHETHISYPRLISSLVALWWSEPLLRLRAVLALLVFAAFSVLWTALVLPLSSAPLSLSHSRIGLFGLVGLAGALAASRTGGWADRGWYEWTTGAALALLVLSWLPIAYLHHSLLALVVGIILLDLAVQAVHVTSQSMLFRRLPEARSRLVAVYMTFYSIGSGAGAIASTWAYAHAGWTGVSILGASLSAAALVLWASTRQRTTDFLSTSIHHQPHPKETCS